MFKLLKWLGIMSMGMMFAPKKGVELREDLVEYLKKFRPQLKRLIVTLEQTWEQTKAGETDEVSAEIELKLANVRDAVDELDGARTKELAYKALTKVGEASIVVGKEIVHSDNFRSVARDLAQIAVNAIDKASNVYSKAKDISTSFSEDVYEESVKEKINVIKIEDTPVKNEKVVQKVLKGAKK